MNERKSDVGNKICPNCGVKNVDVAFFCTQCGVSLAKVEKRHTKKKKVIPIFACVAICVMFFGAIISYAIKVLPGIRRNNELFYLKDNDMYMAKGNKYIPELVTDNFYEEHGMVYGYEDPVTLCQYTEDDYIFYMQDVEDSEGDFCYKKYGSEEEGTRIDFNVNFFHAYSKNCVIYRKDEKLYFLTERIRRS